MAKKGKKRKDNTLGQMMHRMNVFKKELFQMLSLEDDAEQHLYRIDDFASMEELDSVLLDVLKKWSRDFPSWLGALPIELSEKQILDNPFFQAIKIPERETPILKNGFTLGKTRLLREGIAVPYTYSIRDPRTLKVTNYRAIPLSDVCLPVLSYNGSTIMSVEPFEINSFKPFIERASGHVLLCGCGLGMLVYMVALKPEVQKVTVVDCSLDVINLCSKEIISQFSDEFKNKISLVHSDAIDFLKTCDSASYTCCNVDIWNLPADMIFSYLRCLPIEFEARSNNIDISFSYWLEEQLRLVLQKVFMQVFCDYPVLDDIDYPGNNLIYRIGKDLVEAYGPFKKPQDFKDFVNTDIVGLRKMLLEWYGNNIALVDKYEFQEQRMSILNRERGYLRKRKNSD